MFVLDAWSRSGSFRVWRVPSLGASPAVGTRAPVRSAALEGCADAAVGREGASRRDSPRSPALFRETLPWRWALGGGPEAVLSAQRLGSARPGGVGEGPSAKPARPEERPGRGSGHTHAHGLAADFAR